MPQQGILELGHRWGTAQDPCPSPCTTRTADSASAFRSLNAMPQSANSEKVVKPVQSAISLLETEIGSHETLYSVGARP